MSGDTAPSKPPETIEQRQARKRLQLKRLRAMATLLLGAMVVIFILARFNQAHWPVLSYVAAFAEAGMVGAIADWFAVVVLFRHPFGLPIPHTAIIPKNKKRIGESLGQFIAGNFLSSEEIGRKLHDLNPALVLARWLVKPRNALFVAHHLASVASGGVAALRHEETRKVVGAYLTKAADQIDVPAILARVLEAMASHGHHQKIFDRFVGFASAFLLSHQEDFRAKLSVKSKWWVPEWLDDALFRKIMSSLEQTLVEMQDSGHPWRSEFDRVLEEFVSKLKYSTEYHADIDRIKNELLSSPSVRASLSSLWDDLCSRLSADADKPSGLLSDSVARIAMVFAERLQADPKMQEMLNLWLERLAIGAIDPNRAQIGGFIADIVSRWETKTLVDRLETQVGGDLQYIRINGTLVGGLVGLTIHLVEKTLF